MKLDLSNIAYLLVDIESFKRVSFFRRNGPLKSVTIPIREYRSLSANNFSIRILKLVTMDGKTISPEEAELKETVEEEIKTDFVQEEIFTPVPDEPEKVEIPLVEVTPAAVDIVAPQKIDLLSTIHEEESQINVRVLSEQEYSLYTKNELLVFLSKIAPSLPADVAEKVMSGNLSKEKVMSIIRENVIS